MPKLMLSICLIHSKIPKFRSLRNINSNSIALCIKLHSEAQDQAGEEDLLKVDNIRRNMNISSSSCIFRGSVHLGRGT